MPRIYLRSRDADAADPYHYGEDVGLKVEKVKTSPDSKEPARCARRPLSLAPDPIRQIRDPLGPIRAIRAIRDR